MNNEKLDEINNGACKGIRVRTQFSEVRKKWFYIINTRKALIETCMDFQKWHRRTGKNSMERIESD
jgi:hypothetical protein